MQTMIYLEHLFLCWSECIYRRPNKRIRLAHTAYLMTKTRTNAFHFSRSLNELHFQSHLENFFPLEVTFERYLWMWCWIRNLIQSFFGVFLYFMDFMSNQVFLGSFLSHGQILLLRSMVRFRVREKTNPEPFSFFVTFRRIIKSSVI